MSSTESKVARGSRRPDISIEDRFVHVPGGRVFTRKWTPEKPAKTPPIILFHDSLGCVELWRDFPEELARRLNQPVVAYDRLGFGKSSPREALPSMDFVTEEAEFAFPVVRHALGITECSLFGHSVGGAMALVAASLDEDGLVSSVATEAAQAFVEERTRHGIREAQALFRQPGRFAGLEKWHGDKADWVLHAWTDVWLAPAFSAWCLDPHLDRVRCPVLAIHGDRDEYGSLAFPRRIVDGVAGPAESLILEGCGHVPHRERTDEVFQALDRHIQSLSSQRS